LYWTLVLLRLLVGQRVADVLPLWLFGSSGSINLASGCQDPPTPLASLVTVESVGIRGNGSYLLF
jgi:hypothetical protein